MSFEHDAQRGKIGTKQFILPVLRKIGGGEVIHTEEQASHFERCLDFHSIDGFIKSVKGLLPFAARCQFDKNYQSFAIRYSRPTEEPTEYKKITEAIKNNSMRPFYHAQAYVVDGQATVAVTHTDDLFNFIKRHEDKTKIVPQDDGTELLAAFWRDLEQSSVKLKKFLVSADGNIQQLGDC